jgi:phosphatidylserine/phosphatidylglycerophosphate/cardiolipin synthase-like enzyme
VKLPGSDSPVELYSNQTQDDLTELYRQAIASATESITLSIYGLTDETIIQALKAKCDAGISVHIVCDAKASKGISKRLPDASLVRRFGKGLMHQKILIVDQSRIWLGSANLTHSSLNLHGNLVLGMHHPALARALTQRTKSMDDEGAYTPLLHQMTRAGNQQLEIWVLPDDQKGAKRMIDLFRAAKKSIRVAMFTRDDFTHELSAAAKRGVKVEAVIDRYQGRGASSKIVTLLEREGIPVSLSSGQGLLHHKFVYIDETILVNGSANWTKAAFQDNDDYFAVIYPLNPAQQQKMDRLWQVIKQRSEKPALTKMNSPI